MYHFFVEQNAKSNQQIYVTDSVDVNHIKNVLRLKEKEQVIISFTDSDEDVDYYCSIDNLSDNKITLNIDWTEEKRELSSKIYLFQGLPKNDKMELIIQKAVELGVHKVIPVATKRSVVKLDSKKEAAKLKRWQAISESAAKQSKRSIIPEITNVMTVKEAMNYAKDIDIKLMPYENAKGMGETKRIVESVKSGNSVAILIGPEGGFDIDEVSMASENGFAPVTLGKRILRTETAGMMLLSVLMYSLEE